MNCFALPVSIVLTDPCYHVITVYYDNTSYHTCIVIDQFDNISSNTKGVKNTTDDTGVTSFYCKLEILRGMDTVVGVFAILKPSTKKILKVAHVVNVGNF